MELVGKIKVIGDTFSVGSNGFQKRELVITTDEQYPQHIQIDFVQDKCEKLDGLAVGQNVKVHVNVRGREWINPQGEAKYFNSFQGWRIESASGGGSTENFPEANTAPPVPSDDEVDDLPF